MLFGFIKSHSKALIAVLCALLGVALAVLCAFLVVNSTRQVASANLSSYSYISEGEAESLSSTIEAESSEQPTSSVQSAPEAPKPRYIVINAYSPYQKQQYAAGSAFTAIISARPDSTDVTATFNGQTINLVMQPYDLDANGSAPEFVNFAGQFTVPSGNEENINLGRIKFSATHGGVTETFYSPAIICLRDTVFDKMTVVEVVTESAETFNGNTTDDQSDPRYSPLPKGTVDYKVGGIITDKESGNSYYKLRCGKRIYVERKNSPDTNKHRVSTAYVGELPDTNQISFAGMSTSDSHTYMTFNTAWKAPFELTLAPQGYTNPSKADFTISDVTYNHVDIKFFYTTEIGGEVVIPDNPLFVGAKLITEPDGAVLRLYLKRVGGINGWDAYYNESGQLVFKFLNSKTASPADNKYGADLTGITVLLDVGHGGRDIGAEGLNPTVMPEAERNLVLASKVKAELEGIGATVVMTRNGDTAVTVEQRCSIMRRTSPNLCVSIHHDSSTRASANGAGFFCFNAFSDRATRLLFNRTSSSGIYGTVTKSWHYFYLGRVTSCPLVLIENGYISNPQDFEGISSDETNNKKAESIVLGIADYFLSMK